MTIHPMPARKPALRLVPVIAASKSPLPRASRLPHLPVRLPPLKIAPPLSLRERLARWWRNDPAPLWHRVAAVGILNATARLPYRWRA